MHRKVKVLALKGDWVQIFLGVEPLNKDSLLADAIVSWRRA
ncbi:hypothetical protein [Archangium sp.]|nr:hypothetical protein [Archangium sp.]